MDATSKGEMLRRMALEEGALVSGCRESGAQPDRCLELGQHLGHVVRAIDAIACTVGSTGRNRSYMRPPFDGAGEARLAVNPRRRSSDTH
jgi:hypothetical protein